MPRSKTFDEKIEKIYQIFNKKYIKMKNLRKSQSLYNREYKLLYHMHPNRRMKKMYFQFPSRIYKNGPEANLPFFIVTVNKINKDDKTVFKCIYQNFLEGGIQTKILKFSLNEDDLKKNEKEWGKIVKMIKEGFRQVYYQKGPTFFMKRTVDFYQQ
jgi:hypothetical protein